MKSRNLILAIIASLALLAALSLISMPASVKTMYLWNAGKGFTEWQAASPDTPIFLTPQGLLMNSANDFPLIASPNYLSIMIDDHDLLAIRMKAGRGGVGNIFWADYQNPRFDRSRSIMIYSGPAGRVKDLYIDLAVQEKGWMRRIDSFLINPMPGPGSCEIESIAICRSTIKGKILAAWQEFWGPRGRDIIGSTINTIQSSNILGRSVYFYLYWLIALFFVPVGGFALYLAFVKKGRGWPLKALDRTLLFTIVFIFLLWGLMEANDLYNQVHIFKSETYLFGKSLEEKRALVNPAGFYDFLKFCEAKLPPREEIEIRVSRIYDDIKINYYLYPHHVVKQAKYIVVVNQAVEPELLKASRLFAKFNDASYILERK